MATHSRVLAWRIPGTAEPGGLPSVGSQSQTRLKRLSSSGRSRGWVLRLGQGEAKLPDLAKPCFWRLEERTWQGLSQQQSPAALPVYCLGDGRVMGLTMLVPKHQDSRTVSMSKKGKELLDPCQRMDHTGLENGLTGQQFDGPRTSCFAPNFMDCINLLRLLYSSGEGKVSPNMTELEIIASQDLEPDVTTFRKKRQYGIIFHLRYGVNSILYNKKNQAVK